MRYNEYNYGSFFEPTSKSNMPQECIKCVRDIAQKPNNINNSKLKNKINLNMKSKHGVTKWNAIKLVNNMRF